MVRLRHGPFFLFLSLSSPFPLRFPFPSFTLPVPSFSFSFPFSFLFLSFFVFLLFLSFFFSFRFPFPFLFLSLLLCFPFPSSILPFPFPFPRSCESFGEGVKPALGKTIRGKKSIPCEKTIWKGSGCLQDPDMTLSYGQVSKEMVQASGYGYCLWKSCQGIVPLWRIWPYKGRVLVICLYWFGRKSRCAHVDGLFLTWNILPLNPKIGSAVCIYGTVSKTQLLESHKVSAHVMTFLPWASPGLHFPGAW